MQIRFVVVPTVLLFTLFVLASCEEETPTRAARRVNKSTGDDGNDNLKRTKAETLAYWQEYGVKTGFEYFHKYIASKNQHMNCCSFGNFSIWLVS